jgi:predicted RNA binding protein YcfA (HicA-like mRNA interferase family)
VSNVSAPTGKQLIAVLSGLGFDVVRIKGSHHFLRHADGRTTLVPVHSGETLGPGLQASILRDVQIRRGDLQDLL